jgi:hypothetical protein
MSDLKPHQNKRMSFTSMFGLSLGEWNIDAGEVDELLRGSLYPSDSALLEKRCSESLQKDMITEGSLLQSQNQSSLNSYTAFNINDLISTGMLKSTEVNNSLN